MDLAEQVQQQRLVDRLEKDADRRLVDRETMQTRRWELLRRVAGYAGTSYTEMRRAANVDGKHGDQGAPLWLGAILIVGVELIPETALMGAFIGGLTRHTQKLVTYSARKRLKPLLGLPLKRSSSPVVSSAQQDRMSLVNQIKEGEELTEQVVKQWKNPALKSILKVSALALEKSLGLGNQPFVQNSARESIRSDVPLVQIQKSLDGWIDAQILVEDFARKQIRQEIRALADIATSPTPGKEAKAKKAEAIAEAVQGDGVLFDEPLPNTNKAALDQLTELRNRLAPDPVESRPPPVEEDLFNLQLAIESMIWVTSHDFTPRFTERPPPYFPWFIEGADDTTAEERTVMEPAPLPDGLWEKLIERYPAPDGKVGPNGRRETYKEVGPSVHLPGMMGPPMFKWSPEVRLSHYFSKVLYGKIDEENKAMVQRFKVL